jgi:hypothetical protein
VCLTCGHECSKFKGRLAPCYERIEGQERLQLVAPDRLAVYECSECFAVHYYLDGSLIDA